MKTRRDFIKKTAVVTVGAMAISKLPAAVVKTLGDDATQFKLPPLGYEYNALEPHIDAKTMEIHHSKHHQAYVDKLNKALAEAKVSGVSLDNLVKNISKYNTAIRNNAGGHWNHSFFWELMKPQVDAIREAFPLEKNIETSFGTMDDFHAKFNDAAKSVFGSGWAWLVVNKDKKLEIGTTPNQDNPLMDVSTFKGIPVIGIDVWEHAYYLKHQNVRADYINDWWNVVNWGFADQLYTEALK